MNDFPVTRVDLRSTVMSSNVHVLHPSLHQRWPGLKPERRMDVDDDITLVTPSLVAGNQEYESEFSPPSGGRRRSP